MFIIYTIVIVLIGLIALVGTFIAGRQVDQTIDSLENMPAEQQGEHLNNHHFKDVKRNLGVLTWIYVVTFLVAIIGAVIYMAFIR